MSVDISKLIQLEHNLKQYENISQIYYAIVNQTREFVEYEQAVLVSPNINGKLKTDAISDVATVDSTSLFVQIINELSQNLYKKYNNEKIEVLNINSDIDETLKKELVSYTPSNVVWIPLKTYKNSIEIEYYLLLFRKNPFDKKELEVLNFLSQSYSHFLFAHRKCSFLKFMQKFHIKSKYIKYSFLVLVLLMFLPVNMSVLAPFEVQAKKPFVVTSAIEGVIDEITVESNDKVTKGQLLVKMKQNDLQNHYEIRRRKLNTSKAKLHTLKQASFYDSEKKSQITQLEMDVKLAQAELNFAKSKLDKTMIYSKNDGIAIINNSSEWIGKPIVTGEKIFLIAKEEIVEVKIMLNVSDTIFLQKDADIKLFFDNTVFQSWDAKISYIAYKPELTPEGVLSYKIIADFTNIKKNEVVPKIGLRGTAKIYSNKVSLFFYLFRKPITSLRQWLAW